MKEGERGRDILLNIMYYVYVCHKQKYKVCVKTLLISLILDDVCESYISCGKRCHSFL